MECCTLERSIFLDAQFACLAYKKTSYPLTILQDHSQRAGVSLKQQMLGLMIHSNELDSFYKSFA
jgi:hypothetical protein